MAASQQDGHALLWDIFHFLSENLSSEMLSDTADNERKALLERLSSVFPDIPSTYLDMNLKSHCDEEYIFPDARENKKIRNDSLKISNEKDSQYSDSLSEIILKNTNPENICAQINISYKDLNAKAVKCGPLLRRERLFFLDQYRRCWAGLMGHTLLVYACERDTKPVLTINVQGFSAHQATNIFLKDPKKKNLCFEIVCPGQKTYHFIARTTKDMDQWIAAICEASGYQSCLGQQKLHQPLRKLPSLPHEDMQEDYDDIAALQENDEEIYHDISVLVSRDSMEDRNPPTICSLSLEVDDIEEQEYNSSIKEDDTYDDVNSTSAIASAVFSANMNKLHTLKVDTESSVPRTESADNICENGENDEEIYDDIGPMSINAKQVNSSPRRINLISVDKNMRDQIMASVIKMQNNSCPSKVEAVRSLKSESFEELYESIENPNF